MRRSLLPLLLLAVLFSLIGQASAQLHVGLEIKRRLFVAYEPIIATVTIRNMSGRDLPMADGPGVPWFSFEVMRQDGRPVPPLADAYKLDPFIIPNGQTIRRQINLNLLYPISDYGLYRVRANVYYSPHQEFFQSASRTIEISDGKVIWQQSVGVPDGVEGAGETRLVSLMTFRKFDANHLYIRVRDPESNTIYCTFGVAKLIGGMEPEIQFDAANQIHLLQVTGPKTYLHTHLGLNGEFLGRQVYHSVKSRPTLRHDAAGNVIVRGGRAENDPAIAQELGTSTSSHQGVPKLSERPPNLPRE